MTLTTNTELNAEFYRKNGFTLADETRIARNDVSMKNWTFVKTVPELCPVIPPSSTNTTESYPVIPA